jgi:hypothetical protein
MLALIVIVICVLAYGSHHARHYRRHRRLGMGVWYSLRGPFGTRVTVRKRF